MPALPPALRHPPLAAAVALFALAYYAAAELGLSLSVGPRPFVTFWAPRGLALAVLSCWPGRGWPVFLLGQVAANVLFNHLHAKPFPASLGFVAANALASAAGAALLRAWAGGPFRLAGLGALTALGAVSALTAALAATVGSTVVALGLGGSFAEAWPMWWAADLVGALAVAPVVLSVWPDGARPEPPAGRRPREAAALAAAAAALAVLLLNVHGVTPLPLLAFPLLLWAAIRFGFRAAALAGLALAVVAVTGIKREHRHYDRLGVSLAEQAFLVQGFVSITGWTFLALAVVLRERRLLEEQLRQAQKLEAVGRLAGGIAHDFNNLLTVSNGYVEMLLGDLAPGAPMRAELEQVQRAGERAATLTRQLLEFSRQSVAEPRALDLNEVVGESEKLLRRVLGEDIALTVSLGAGLGRVRADPGQITQVLLNLAVNARDAMPRGGALAIRTDRVELGGAGRRPGRFVALAVRDSGAGIAPAVQARVFEPFFTTKEVGKGTGLGLAVVHGIVAGCGGHIEVESAPGHGATFTVYLPVLPEEAAPSAAPAPARVSAGRGGTVLLVEDEAEVRRIAELALTTAGYRVLAADGGAAALRLAEGGGGIDLLVTDVVMPGLNGREVADAMAARRPGLKVLFISGYTPDEVVRHDVREGEVHFLHKPFTVSELAAKVAEVLEDEPAAR